MKERSHQVDYKEGRGGRLFTVDRSELRKAEEKATKKSRQVAGAGASGSTTGEDLESKKVILSSFLK